MCFCVRLCVRPCVSVYQSCRPEGSPPHTQPGPFSMSVQTRAPTSVCPGQGVRAGSQRADLGGLTRTICSWSHAAFPLEADCNSQAGNSVPGSFTLGWNQNLLCFGGRNRSQARAMSSLFHTRCSVRPTCLLPSPAAGPGVHQQQQLPLPAPLAQAPSPLQDSLTAQSTRSGRKVQGTTPSFPSSPGPRPLWLRRG